MRIILNFIEPLSSIIQGNCFMLTTFEFLAYKFKIQNCFKLIFIYIDLINLRVFVVVVLTILNFIELLSFNFQDSNFRKLID